MVIEHQPVPKSEYIIVKHLYSRFVNLAAIWNWAEAAAAKAAPPGPTNNCN